MEAKDLLELKEKVDAAKLKVSKYQAQLEMKMEELKKTWKCATPEQANEKLNTMEKELQELEQKINKGIHTLKEKYFNETRD